MSDARTIPLIHVLFKGKIVQSHKMEADTATIGRLPDNDIVIDNMGVSRHHAQIVRDGDAFRIEDLGSANGFKVNGMRIKHSPLTPGDEILLGKHTLVFQMSQKGVAGFFREGEEEKAGHVWSGGQTVFTGLTPQAGLPAVTPDDAPPAEAAAPTSAPAAGLPPAAPGAAADNLGPRKPPAPRPGVDSAAIDAFLAALDGCEYGVKVTFNDSIISVHGLTKKVTCVGRLKENDIVIDNLGVSRLHAEIMQDGDHYVIIDQGSSNGFKVNGMQVRRASLYPGDEVVIGKHHLVFNHAAALKGDLLGEPVHVPAQSTPWRTGTIAVDNMPADAPPPPPPMHAPDDITLVGVPGGPRREVASMADAPAPPAGGQPAAPFSVMVTHDGEDLGHYALAKKTTCIGRLKENDIVLDHERISRLHATLVMDEGRLRIEDQDSANGIRVHGLKLKSSPLYPGDTVTIGPFTLAIRQGAARGAEEARSQGMTEAPDEQGATQVVSHEELERRRAEWAARADAEKAAMHDAAVAPGDAEGQVETPPAGMAPQPPADEEQVDTEPLGYPAMASVEEASAGAESTWVDGPASQPALALRGPGGARVELTGARYGIGSANADIPCKGFLVRAEHARIQRTLDKDYRLEVRAKFPKLKLNGRAVTREKINPGDVITLGKTTWTVEAS